jgi:predicted nucleic acid-binding protein
MAAFFFDTTVLIDLLRGRPTAVRNVHDLRSGRDRVHTSAINVEETVRGLRPAEYQAARDLFSALRIVPLGEREGWLAGEWRREYVERGITLAQADCLIAAAAVSVGARLATGNPRDFPMPELEVDHWPVGA